MRRKKPRRGEPVHAVLDNEALGQLATGRPSRPLLVQMQLAFGSGGMIVLPTSVLVERNHDRSDPDAAEADRVLREVRVDPLSDARAAEAVALRLRSTESGSVVDAHVAAAAHAFVRAFGGTATVATSDPSDISRLLDATEDSTVRALSGVLRL